MLEASSVSVWPVAQRPSRGQRSGRYLPISFAHPAKMLPELARRAIADYSAPGDLVVDPLCGTGTSLVEAVHLGRDTAGIEYEPRWAELARANLALARSQGASGEGSVVTGDARHAGSLLDSAVHGQVALVLTSPPYGPSAHGQVRVRPGRGVAKRDYRYSQDPANLAYLPISTLLEAMVDILGVCRLLLRSDGRVILTVRPWRRHGALIDLPGALVDTAGRAGLVLLERNVALLTGLREDRLVPRASFFQLERVRKARAAGVPLQLIAHEDILVLGL